LDFIQPLKFSDSSRIFPTRRQPSVSNGWNTNSTMYG